METLPHYLKLMRFDKPIGTFLLLWPTLWSLWVAADMAPSPLILWVFISGVFVMRSAGCVINDYADRNIDPLVARTEQRPLASGDLQASDALRLFGLLCVFALILLLCLPSRVWPWSIPAIIVTIAYPFMKRFIQAPQAVLGIAFSFSIPMAYVAVGHAFDTSFWLLFVMNFCWVLLYDTAYAMSDREDDVKIGVKSMAILLGDWDKRAIAMLQVMVIVILLVLKAELNLSHWFYLSVVLVSAMFVYQQWLMADRSRAGCFQAFLNNGWVGGVIFLGLLGG